MRAEKDIRAARIQNDLRLVIAMEAGFIPNDAHAEIGMDYGCIPKVWLVVRKVDLENIQKVY